MTRYLDYHDDDNDDDDDDESGTVPAFRGGEQGPRLGPRAYAR